MWLPVILAATGGCFMVGGLAAVIDSMDDVFTATPITLGERIAICAIVAGAVMIFVAMVLSYLST